MLPVKRGYIKKKFLGILANAASAAKLTTPRAINGVDFDGSAAISIPVLGVGQTLQDVKASRANGVTYTNSTGKPIFVAVSAYVEANILNLYIKVNGAVVSLSTDFPATGRGAGISLSAIVPNGSTYLAYSSTGAFTHFQELR